MFLKCDATTGSEVSLTASITVLPGLYQKTASLDLVTTPAIGTSPHVTCFARVHVDVPADPSLRRQRRRQAGQRVGILPDLRVYYVF